MNIDARRGVVNVAVVGSCRSDFHDSRRINNGAKALTSVTEDFDVEEVSNRVAFRLCVDVVGIFHHPKFVLSEIRIAATFRIRGNRNGHK
jgi:hypothetical protein